MIQTSIISKRYYHINDIDETEYSQVVWERKEKLEKYELLKTEEVCEEIIFEVLGIPRSTLFRWKKQYRLYGLLGLENLNKRPCRVRKPTWTEETERRVYDLRKQYPLWGKAKIAIMYCRKYGTKMSLSSIGRIIRKLVKQGRVKPVSFVCHKKMSKNRIFQGHAQRWKKGMRAHSPGDLIQIDHMTICLERIGYVKHFSAICPVTKFTVEKVYKTASSHNAADFLKLLLHQFPFCIRSIQVDGGSEFMKEFEALCQELNIALWVLPPKSPELNGGVERCNGTFKYEFYSQYDGPPTLDSLQAKLQDFVDFYNKIRPHQGIGYLTPLQFYESMENKGIQSHMS